MPTYILPSLTYQSMLCQCCSRINLTAFHKGEKVKTHPSQNSKLQRWVSSPSNKHSPGHYLMHTESWKEAKRETRTDPLVARLLKSESGASKHLGFLGSRSCKIGQIHLRVTQPCLNASLAIELTHQCYSWTHRRKVISSVTSCSTTLPSTKAQTPLDLHTLGSRMLRTLLKMESKVKLLGVPVRSPLTTPASQLEGFYPSSSLATVSMLVFSFLLGVHNTKCISMGLVAKLKIKITS